jgi:hypothetical protein
MALGLGATHATELARQINAGAFDGHKLAVAGWNPADRQADQGPQRALNARASRLEPKTGASP